MFYIPAELRSTPTRIAATTWLGVLFLYAKVGNGKSHHAVRTYIIPALREGRNVYTNIDFGSPLTFGDTEMLSAQQRAGWLFSKYIGHDVTHLFHIVNGEWIKKHIGLNPDGTPFKEGVPNGSRIIIDEVQAVFSRDEYSHHPKSFFRYLCVCRHYDVDFVFISQNPKLVDDRIISTSSEVLRIKNGGFMSSLFSKTYRVTRHQSLFDYEGFASSVHKFDPDIFLLYKSSDSIVKHQFKAIPSFMALPLIGIACWACFVFIKGRHSFLLGSKPASSIQQVSTPLPEPEVSSKPASTLQNSSAKQAIAQLLEYDKQYRDAPISVSSSDTVKWMYLPAKPYKPVYRDGVELFTNKS